MSRRTKIQIVINIFIGLVFLSIAAYQWYDLYEIEQGSKDGQLSIVLHKIYEVGGKWAVAAFYMPFCLYCFWRAINLVRLSKRYENIEENEEIEDERQ